MTEQWKPVKHFEGLYEVSNKGRVRSLPRDSINSAGVKRHLKGRVLNPVDTSLRGKNWLRVILYKEDRIESIHVARLVWEAFKGEPIPRNVAHIDGNSANNSVENLIERACSGQKVQGK